MPKKKRIVIPLGGNALVVDGLSLESQIEAIRKSMKSIVSIILAFPDYEIVITHGNGPQSGLAKKKEEAFGEDQLSLNLIVAATQGTIGSMMVQALLEELRKEGIERPVTALLTHAMVSSKDPAMLNPTKYVGAEYSEEEKDELLKKGIQMKEYINSKKEKVWREVVPSPKPKGVYEADAILTLLDKGHIVIAGGGGGVPLDENGNPVNGVVDKDYLSAEIAKQIKAYILMILTAVSKVCLNYGKDTEEKLDALSVSEAKSFLESGQFPAGSMGPKIQAAIEFVEKGKDGAIAIIAALDEAEAALEGKAGTRIMKEYTCSKKGGTAMCAAGSGCTCSD
jgi:carbamate kinase